LVLLHGILHVESSSPQKTPNVSMSIFMRLGD
jgi:hypothetical protein